MSVHPPILRRGDTIGIVTLGSPLNSMTINTGISVLRSMGFQVVLGNYVYSVDGFLGGTDEQRAYDLMNMFANQRVRMILPTRGGVGVLGILPYLDYEVISANPKILTGYSDISVLMNALYQFCDLITFSSLMLFDFNPSTPAYNFDQFFEATSKVSAPRIIQNPPNVLLTSKVLGNVTGPIVGGNLSSIVDTLGTSYEIDTKGKVLFLEETHEPINKVYRMINHLKIAGKFNDCIGIVMGECTECQTAYGKSYNDLIDEVLAPIGKALMTNLASAHGTYKAAIPIGALVNLNTYNNTLTVLEPTVSLS
ncbi:muramoyltetrapeptide carboxypeptidase [Paenibacillus sp. 1_12]|uniref:S66 peptidase family protein n=1 Tax=Paenibacillus sp. 1_12 TaxID=1566278 RepID=UPI0008E57D03|nr:LD-carboxypeptidase [Paenibacillus sp. 1_12]SFM17266.1 muramoyltetrapeptide carboxypeptidase [Paenibacillus sp. 1_12]